MNPLPPNSLTPSSFTCSANIVTIRTAPDRFTMAKTNTSTPRKRSLGTTNVTGSLATSTDSTNKRNRQRKSKNRDKKRPTEDASPARACLTTSRAIVFKNRHNDLGMAARHPCDNPIAKKTRPPLVRESPGPPIVDFHNLNQPSNGARDRIDEGPEQAMERLEKMRGAVRTLLECVGEDPDREGLLATPLRYAKALLFLTKGYQVNVESILNNALFNERHNEMVIVKNIEIYSLCEHHMVPFTGKVFLI